jgi:pectinesterase
VTNLLMSIILATTTTASAGDRAGADVVVAPDGSGDFKTVRAAIDAAPQLTAKDRPWMILVKPGTYKELLYIQREKRFITLRGESADAAEKTVITYDLNANMPGPDGEKIGTFHTPTVEIDADDFTCENLTFENSAGRVGQALAIRIDGDRDVFRNCRFRGWQDTILGNRGRHYFENCHIAGAVDFIFGGATEWYEKCHIHCAGGGFITAASTPPEQPFGFVFNHCVITAESERVKTYLGRPWRAYSAVTFLNTEMPSGAIRPEGWQNWGKPEREKTARYAEFGSGGDVSGRAPWAKQLTREQAEAITIDKVFDGWKPAKGESK